MTDARFPERWLLDARLQRVSPDAYRLFGNALMWAAGNRTDGHVPGWALDMIPHARVGDAKELAEAGLWAASGDGWAITDFEGTQSSRDELDALDARRRADRKRKTEERKRKASRDLSRDSHAESVRPGQDRTGQAH